ncbi:MAG: hypothetical protein IT356_08905 [Gemmatimonadaceae bacterium]|nr:hypothetical protein [Gemmatimonadaceae bacterium]
MVLPRRHGTKVAFTGERRGGTGQMCHVSRTSGKPSASEIAAAKLARQGREAGGVKTTGSW